LARALRLEEIEDAPQAISPSGTVKNVVILMRFANHTCTASGS